MSTPVPPQSSPGHSRTIPPVPPIKNPTGSPQSDELPSVGRARSDSLSIDPGKSLHERTLRTASAADELPSVKPSDEAAPPINAEAIKNVKETYDSQLQHYRQVHAQKWLVDNQKQIDKLLNNPKKAAEGAPFKLFVVIGGEKHQLIPVSDSIPDEKLKMVRNFVRKAVKETVKALPKENELTTQLNALAQPLAATYSTLVQLGAPPPCHPKEDLSHSGIRVDMSGNQPMVYSYHLNEDDSSSLRQPLGNDEVEFKNVNLSEPSERDKLDEDEEDNV